MKIFTVLLLVLPLFILIPQDAFTQTTYTWNGGTGDWNVPGNWTPAGVPGVADNAIIASGNVSLVAAVTVAGVEISGPSATLGGDFDLIITGLMVWNGGVMQGSGITQIASGATLRFTSANQKTLYRSIENDGTTIWEDGQLYFGNVVFNNNGVFLDQHSSTQGFNGGANGGVFNNNGTYTKTGASESDIRVPFNNNSSLDLQAGIIELNYWGTSSGTFDVGSGCLLKVAGIPWEFSGPLTGAGTVEFWSPTTIKGIYNITGTTIFASNHTIFDTTATVVSLNNGEELVISGTAEFNTGDEIVLDSLYLNGQFQGSDSLAIMESMIWNGGVMQGSGITQIASGATLRLSGTNQQTLYRTIDNNGTTIWEAGQLYFGNVVFNNNGAFLDQHSSTQGFNGGANGGVFNNHGTYTKSGASESDIRVPFNNNSSLDLQAGIIELNYWGTSSGTFDVGSGCLLKVAGIPWEFSGPLTGAGTVEFWSPTTIKGIYNITGTTIFASNHTIFDTTATVVSLNNGEELVISGTAEFNTGDEIVLDSLYLNGQFQGSDSLAIMESMIWNGGVMQGSGITQIASGATLRLTSANQKTLYRTIDNDGTTIWEDGQLYCGNIVFNNSGAFLDQHSSAQEITGGLAGAIFNNNGTYSKTGTAQTNMDIPFYNIPNSDIRGTGAIRFTNYTFTNEGTINPGDSIGTLTLDIASYPTDTTSSLNMEIGGLLAGTEHDLLEITGMANLNGTLNIDLVNSFIPAIGDTFEIMTYSSYSGNFDTINGLNTGSGVSFIIEMNSTAIKLTTIATPNSPPSMFSLLSPADSTDLSSADTINFVWSESIDPDGDTLYYNLNILGASLDTTFESITDTTFEFISGGILQENTTYHWTMSVTDSAATVACPDTFSFTTPQATTIDDDLDQIPLTFSLKQNYPNPFNPYTTIEFDLPRTSQVSLKIYNILGEEVVTLVSDRMVAGTYKYEWGASNLASGVYIYRLETAEYTKTRMMVLMK